MENTQTPKEACRAFLETQEYAVLSTADQYGVPLASTVMCIVDEKWNVFFCTRKHTKKVKNIGVNPQVAFAIGFGPEPTGVQCGGQATLLEGDEAEQVMTNFMVSRNGYYTTFLKFEGYDFAIYKVNSSWLQWIHFDEKKDKEVVESIL